MKSLALALTLAVYFRGAFNSGGSTPSPGGNSDTPPVLQFPKVTVGSIPPTGSLVIDEGDVLFIDPEFAFGYELRVTDSLFQSLILPSNGNDSFALLLWDSLQETYVLASEILAGQIYTFEGAGTDRFLIFGIEEDPNIGLGLEGFVSGVTLAAGTTAQITMKPILLDSSAIVPEPSSLALLGIGTISLFGYGWRQRKRLHGM